MTCPEGSEQQAECYSESIPDDSVNRTADEVQCHLAAAEHDAGIGQSSQPPVIQRAERREHGVEESSREHTAIIHVASRDG